MPWNDENLSARDTEMSLYIKHFTSEYRFDPLPNYMKEEVLFTPIGVAQQEQAIGPIYTKMSQLDVCSDETVCRVFLSPWGLSFSIGNDVIHSII